MDKGTTHGLLNSNMNRPTCFEDVVFYHLFKNESLFINISVKEITVIMKLNSVHNTCAIYVDFIFLTAHLYYASTFLLL